jgi:putative glutamine amidotransferase
MSTGARPPRIAVMFGLEPDDRRSLYRGYVDAIYAVGAMPIMISAGPAECDEMMIGLVDECDALLLTGGFDVDPACYGEVDGGLVKGIDADRDRLELSVVAHTRELGMRTLGICRGLQLLNVALGGTLHQDLVTDGLDHHAHEHSPGQPTHPVRVVGGSLIERVLGDYGEVNSLHHQGIKDLAPGVEATAFAPDGLIEAFEAEEMLAVQWHPERMIGFDPAFLAAFAWLAEARR